MVSVIRLSLLMVYESILVKFFLIKIQKNGVNVVFLSNRMSGNIILVKIA